MSHPRRRAEVATGARGALGLALVAAVCAWSACGRPTERVGRPVAAGALHGSNVLLVTIDTLRADYVGVYGSTRGATPTIDRFAREGLQFEVTYAHVPLTLPSHTTIMTGVYPFTSGVRDNGSFRFDGKRPTLAGILKRSGYATGAFVGAFPLDARFGLTAGFDVYDDHYGSRPAGGELSVLERPADDVLAPAYAWIASHPLDASASHPWFAWVHLYDPHDPYVAPEPYRSRYAADPYAGEVAYADAALGAFLDRLRAQRFLDRTLVVMTSDHGESLGEHGERTHGLFAYDATLRVPLVVWAPFAIEPAVVSLPMRLIDVTPTVLDLVGVETSTAVDGRSARTHIGTERGVEAPPSYFEALNANLTRNWAPLSGVVLDGMKLIDLPIPELYDLYRDPHEQRNLYARQPDAAKPLERQLDALTSRGVKPVASPVDSETQQRLQSLGYVVSPVARPARTYTARDDPKNLIGLQNRLDAALDALKAGSPDVAERTLSQLVAERPDFTIAYDRLAFIYRETSRLEKAIATLESASRTGAIDAASLATLGGYLQEANRFDRSVAVLKAALALNPSQIDAYEKLGVTYTRMGRFAEAERMFRQVLSVAPSSATTFNNLGSLFLAQRRDADAIDALSHAIAIDPTLANAHNGLGVAYARGGDRARAVDEWQTALALRPDLADARENLERLRR